MPLSEPDQATDMLAIALVILATIILFLGTIAIRAVTNRNWEVRLTDAVIALVPVLVWLVVTGRLKELKFGNEGFTAEFQEAIAAPIKSAVEVLPIQNLSADEKSGLPELPKLIEKKDQVLIFVLGKQYVAGIAKEYFAELTKYPFFRFVEFQQNGGAFFGLIDARLLAVYLKMDSDWYQFIAAIKDVNRSYLEVLPAYVGVQLAVSDNADKSYVLEKMEQQHLDWLPVTGTDGRLLGIVERSAILARLVLDLNKQLRR